MPIPKIKKRKKSGKIRAEEPEKSRKPKEIREISPEELRSRKLVQEDCKVDKWISLENPLRHG